MKSCALAASAAFTISSVLTSLKGAPYAMFSPIDMANKTGSCSGVYVRLF